MHEFFLADRSAVVPNKNVITVQSILGRSETTTATEVNMVAASLLNKFDDCCSRCAR